jgi:hypothetical protein
MKKKAIAIQSILNMTENLAQWRQIYGQHAFSRTRFQAFHEVIFVGPSDRHHWLWKWGV